MVKMADSAVSVQVALRIRPLVESEISKGYVKCLETVPNEPQVLIKDLSFTYNHVFPPEVSQAEFYDTAVKGLVDGLFKGYNVTILAYGQTGSGKTHSMGTAYSGGPVEEMGVIPRAVKDIFQKISTLKEQYDFGLQVSFMELYQEQLFDLLSKSNRDQSIVDIREDQQKGIVIPGLTEIKVFNAKDTLDCLVRGSHRRAVGATAMNSQSSRSHAIFTIHIQQQKISDENSLTSCKFHLVDLAGSERANKTKATGNRFREGVKINEGLLALGNVISRLGEGCTGFIGYRDSKLTRLLQDSLGGNSVTLMIACVSPADYNLEETISTLRYADRARKIKNKPVVNQDPKAAEIIRLKNTIQQLRMELLGKGTIHENGDGDNKNELVLKLRQEIKELRFKNNNLLKALDSSVMEIACLNEKVILNEASNERMTHKLTEMRAIFDETKGELSTSENSSNNSTLHRIKEKIDEMQKELKKVSTDILDHDIEKRPVSEVSSKCSGIQEDLHLESSESITDLDVEEQQDNHLSQQAALTTELQQLNKELAWKQTLVAQVAQNHMNLAEYQVNIRENEDVIIKLQKERDELMMQIRNMQSNASSKLAEERRKRVQALETEIAELQKKLIQQNRLLKLKEKNDQRIATLNSEIQQIKASKVKLIRTMRAESESFRNWKITRDREMAKLKDQDRKRENDMARMQQMFGKKHNVLKRKVEETIATNKRLRDALERQKNAQTRRLQIGPGKADQVRAWVEQEVDVALSTVDAQKTLEQLMEDRASLQQKLEIIKAKPLSNNENEQTPNEEIEKERKQLQDDISFRTAQIADLQEKIIASDQENKAKSRWDIVQSLGEAKYALKHLFDMIAESRRSVDAHKERSTELEDQLTEVVAKVAQCQQEMDKLREQHRHELAELEGEGEYKISVLLRQLRSNGSSNTKDENDLEQRIKFQERELERMDAVQAELENYKKEVEELREQLQEVRTYGNRKDIKNCRTPEKKAKKMKQDPDHLKLDFEPMNLSESDEEVYADSAENDPDFRLTPIYKRVQLSKTLPRHMRVSAGVKRNSNGEIQCNCKGKCQNRLCGCRKNNMKCSSACKCSKENCKNMAEEEEDFGSKNIKEETPDSICISVPNNTKSDTSECR
ncbi:chromosome-associated kinesin KIF4A-like [Ctenocephalides felis]|uniref:chromosome-associated kinesin KIF4A-like n=1 Tax=Ctenocephalides felis TaxID=7515 RepID=UPI000E6E5772|nr:chromosome-associated kinesin KIF4A-like [Ctenocephalides felis]